ncbi:hypothetical protein FKM82_012463 [Ascaphus truei]
MSCNCALIFLYMFRVSSFLLSKHNQYCMPVVFVSSMHLTLFCSPQFCSEILIHNPLFTVETSSKISLCSLYMEVFSYIHNFYSHLIFPNLTGKLSPIFKKQAKGFLWLPINLLRQCKIIMTTVTSHMSYKCMVSRSDVQMAECENISDEGTRLSIFQQQLALPNKHIAPGQLKKIINTKRRITPFQLAIIASQLRICGMCRDESPCIEGYLEALSTEELWSLVIQRWC